MTTLTDEDGIRQFLGIGTGLPTQENVHQIAQRIAPDSRVVYVDNDPVVLAHARALLTSGPEDRTDYIDADFKQPAQILEQAVKTLDFDQPVALVLVAILHFVEDEEAYPIVRELVDALPSGSRLVLSHLTEDLNPENVRAVQRTYTERGFTFVLRSKAEVERFFTDNGLELDDPGVVPAHRWRPDGNAPAPEAADPSTSPPSTTSRRSATATSTTSRTRTSTCTRRRPSSADRGGQEVRGGYAASVSRNNGCRRQLCA